MRPLSRELYDRDLLCNVLFARTHLKSQVNNREIITNSKTRF